MKKVLLVVIIMVIYMMIGHVAVESELIPEDAIRIRVIASSDDKNDQEIKLEIKKELENYFFNLLKDIKGVSNASSMIKNSIPEVEEIVSSVAKNNDFNVNYGMNYFPAKEYKGVTYKEGYYESLVVTLGKGKGQNWWCVLFPPLCLLENSGMEEVEYRSFVADFVNKYF